MSHLFLGLRRFIGPAYGGESPVTGEATHPATATMRGKTLQESEELPIFSADSRSDSVPNVISCVLSPIVSTGVREVLPESI